MRLNRSRKTDEIDCLICTNYCAELLFFNILRFNSCVNRNKYYIFINYLLLCLSLELHY